MNANEEMLTLVIKMVILKLLHLNIGNAYTDAVLYPCVLSTRY